MDPQAPGLARSPDREPLSLLLSYLPHSHPTPTLGSWPSPSTSPRSQAPPHSFLAPPSHPHPAPPSAL